LWKFFDIPERRKLMEQKLFEERLSRLRVLMASRGLDAFVTYVAEGYNWEGLYYLSNFRGTAGALVVTSEDPLLIVDGRYCNQARQQSPYPVHLQESGNFFQTLQEVLEKFGVNRVGFEGNRISYGDYRKLSNMPFWWDDAGDMLSALERQKGIFEIQIIRKAIELAQKGFMRSLEKVSSSMTERQYAALLEFFLRTEGAEGFAFEPVVASGLRSALPHGRATDKLFSPGEWVVVDFGARFQGYICDITRVFSLGKPDPWAREIHELLCRAQEAAKEVVEVGVPAIEMDTAARSLIDSFGYGKAFSHGLGHGIGLYVHEGPRISSLSQDVLASGDVFTIEPGIYLEGRGGLRMEDNFFLREDGVELLSSNFEKTFFIA